MLFSSALFLYLCIIRVITLQQSNEKLKNKKDCYLFKQLKKLLILKQAIFLAKNYDNS